MNEEDVKPSLQSNQNESQTHDEIKSPEPEPEPQSQSEPQPQPQSQSNPTPTQEENANDDEDSLANLTCSICLGSPSPLVVTQCGHVACGGCLAASLASQPRPMLGFEPQAGTENNGKCPVCRTMLVGGWGTSMRGAILKMGTGTT
ncbi:uncharacterized protein MELLADRAFT_107737 [Melampsora larici-populina 98AG31]|uniref:RING-type domain-containing protein n=1 Tax=Melampsora larici-populina (strain 98AG31 / pathotype 3-4-7) TaxID=747676 RepID=F4RQS6_MELLP|nr:uncharacterized protein MELLADRAFT_107737 [Melampsora larici-populina 98AG31]EGG05089.1 hypothetical protein MELLADRAFT_107737 [Melampsora larici-populina 98AG31]